MKLIQRFMRFFYKHLYHGLAWSYDLVAWAVSFGHWKDWTAASLKYVTGPRVLEIGHGPGHLQVALSRLNAAIIGLDESAQMSRIAARRLRGIGLPVRLLRGDARSLPLEGSTVNTILATFPSEYIFSTDTAAEIMRVLVPGGQAVILPLAWPKLWILQWLFSISGQGSPLTETTRELLLAPFRAGGFEAWLESVELDSGILVFLFARKPSLGGHPQE